MVNGTCWAAERKTMPLWYWSMVEIVWIVCLQSRSAVCYKVEALLPDLPLTAMQDLQCVRTPCRMRSRGSTAEFHGKRWAFVVEIKVMSICIAPIRWNISKALRYSTHRQGMSQFYLHTLRFIRKRNEPYLPLPSQPQLVLVYRPRRDGRLSRP